MARMSFVLFCLLFATTFPAVAGGDILTQPLLSVSGKPLPDTTDPAEVKKDGHEIACRIQLPGQVNEAERWCAPLTLRVLAVNVLSATFCSDPRAPCPADLAEEKNLSAGQKIARADLARRIYLHPDAVQLTTDEKALLKRLIGAVYPGPILADVMPLLDPTAKPEAVKP